MEIYIIESQCDKGRPSPQFVSLLPVYKGGFMDNCSYNNQCLTKMNGRRNKVEGGGSKWWKCVLCCWYVPFCKWTVHILPPHYFACWDGEKDESDGWESDSFPMLLRWSARPDWQHILQPVKTCTWSHATTPGKAIFHGAQWKSSTLPFQTHSGEQHILWRVLCVSVKGICYAGFTEWVRFRPMRASQRAAWFLWKQ